MLDVSSSEIDPLSNVIVRDNMTQEESKHYFDIELETTVLAHFHVYCDDCVHGICKAVFFQFLDK